MQQMADRWFAARHKSAAAKWGLLNLRHQGFVALWPTFDQRVVRRNKVIIVQAPNIFRVFVH
jgi:hypothetical protein